MDFIEYTCFKVGYNRNMGYEFYSDENSIFLCDKEEIAVKGDLVRIERDSSGFYHRVWVNGNLVRRIGIIKPHETASEKSTASGNK